MLDYIRYSIAIWLVKKSTKELKKGDYKSIIKSLKYFKWSVRIVPPNDALTEFRNNLRESIKDLTNEKTETC